MDVVKIAEASLNFCKLMRGAPRLSGGFSGIENEERKSRAFQINN